MVHMEVVATIAATCARLAQPSLAMIRPAWVSTVRSAMKSRAAICRLALTKINNASWSAHEPDQTRDLRLWPRRPTARLAEAMTAMAREVVRQHRSVIERASSSGRAFLAMDSGRRRQDGRSR